MDLREIIWNGIIWIEVAKDRDQWKALVNTVMNLPFPYNAGKFLSSCKIGSFSRRAQLHESVSIKDWYTIQSKNIFQLITYTHFEVSHTHL
jgi:hypothetical protein